MSAPRVAVALALAALSADAEAGGGRPSYTYSSRTCVLSGTICHLRLAGPADGVATAVATVSSEVGDEKVALVSAGTRLHGGAAVSKLPEKDAKLAITLYDAGSLAIASYTGTLGTDGAVTLVAETICDKAGCEAAVPLIAAELVAEGKAYALVLDLADADAVAYGKVTVTDGAGTTGAEIGWEAIDGLWEATLSLEHTGPVDLKARLFDDAGEVVATAKTTLGAAWDDGASGISTVATDEDPLTYVGLVGDQLIVTSEGWSADDDLPLSAKIALTDGDTVTVPVNSYQRRRKAPELLYEAWDALIEANYRPLVVVDDVELDVDAFADLAAPVCAEGTCVMLVPEEDGYSLSVTQYRWDAAFDADDVTVTLSAVDADGYTKLAEKVTVTFDDEIIVVFAQDLTIDGDPAGLPVAGRVRLLGAEGDKLGGGKLDAELVRDDGGDLDLAGTHSDLDLLEPTFAILFGGAGDPCGSDKAGWVEPPPIAASIATGPGKLDVVGYGSYTRVVKRL